MILQSWHAKHNELASRARESNCGVCEEVVVFATILYVLCVKRANTFYVYNELFPTPSMSCS